MGRTLIASVAGVLVALGVVFLHHLGGNAAATGLAPVAAASPTAAAPVPSAAASSGAADAPSDAPSTGAATQTPYTHVIYTGTGAPGLGGGYTAIFTAGTDWSISYSYDCSSLSRPGQFMIFEEGGPRAGAMPVMVLGRKGAAVFFERGDPGRHYLAIESLCAWTVTVADGG